MGEHQESQGREGGGLGPLVSGYSPAGKDMFPHLILRGRVSCSLSSRSPCPSSWPPHIGPDISLRPILYWQHRGSRGYFSHWRRTEVSRKPSLVPSIEEQEPGGHSLNRTHRDRLLPTVYYLPSLPKHTMPLFPPFPSTSSGSVLLIFYCTGILGGTHFESRAKMPLLSASPSLLPFISWH